MLFVFCVFRQLPCPYRVLTAHGETKQDCTCIIGMSCLTFDGADYCFRAPDTLQIVQDCALMVSNANPDRPHRPLHLVPIFSHAFNFFLDSLRVEIPRYVEGYVSYVCVCVCIFSPEIVSCEVSKTSIFIVVYFSGL
jgi:hypothetical protein